MTEDRALIPPVTDGQPRPLWSVMIPTYHCAAHLAETLASVLAQDPGPDLMQIEVIDDHSTQDDPAQVVATVGQGRVGFYRQPQNVGHIANFATCLQRSRGELVHLLHGDDLVRPGFYAKLAQGFQTHPDVGAAFCRHAYTDEAGRTLTLAACEQNVRGVLPNAVVRLAQEQRIMTPAMVVRRTVYEQLGGFDRRLVCSEDWEMWVRVAAQFRIWYEPEMLAVYRIHAASNSGRHVRSGADLRDRQRAIAIFADYLPKDQVRAITQRAKATYARSALETAYRLAQQRDWVGMVAQGREALACDHSWATLRQAGRLALTGVADLCRPVPRRSEGWQ